MISPEIENFYLLLRFQFYGYRGSSLVFGLHVDNHYLHILKLSTCNIIYIANIIVLNIEGYKL
jgi:hypothetical protein